MNNSDKTVWDGVILVASYHFLLALISLLGAAAIVVFAIIPNLSTSTANPSSIFLPIVGAVVGVILCGWYGIIGSGLISLKNSARMGAVFLALFGSVGGLFILLGAGIPAVNNLIPDYAAVTGVVISGLCGYILMTVFDLIVLVFLFNRRVRAVFYGEPWNPETAGPSIATRFRSTFLGEPYAAEPEPEPAPRPAIQRTVRRETPPPPPPNPPEDLDTPGDLFTEPAPRKR